MAHGESVQPLQSVKLVYQLWSRSRAAWKTHIIMCSYFTMMLMLMFNHYCHIAIVYDYVGTGA